MNQMEMSKTLRKIIAIVGKSLYEGYNLETSLIQIEAICHQKLSELDGTYNAN